MIHRLAFTAPDLEATIELKVPDAGPVGYRAEFTGGAVGEGFIVVRDDELPRPNGTVAEVRGDGLWTVMMCETPDEHWSFGLEAFGLRVDDPNDRIGDRIPIGYDLEWETPDLVTGELLLARETITVEGRGALSLGM